MTRAPNEITHPSQPADNKIQDFYWHNWSAGQLHQQTRQHTKAYQMAETYVQILLRAPV